MERSGTFVAMEEAVAVLVVVGYLRVSVCGWAGFWRGNARYGWVLAGSASRRVCDGWLEIASDPR